MPHEAEEQSSSALGRSGQLCHAATFHRTSGRHLDQLNDVITLFEMDLADRIIARRNLSGLERGLNLSSVLGAAVKADLSVVEPEVVVQIMIDSCARSS